MNIRTTLKTATAAFALAIAGPALADEDSDVEEIVDGTELSVDVSEDVDLEVGDDGDEAEDLEDDADLESDDEGDEESDDD